MTLPSPTRVVVLLAIVVAFASAGCSSKHLRLTPIPAPSPMPTGAAQSFVYTAIGASDAVGYGASVPCANPPIVATPTCPGGTGYVPLIAAGLVKPGTVVTLLDLGISGAVIGPDIRTVANTYGSLGSAAPCKPRTGGDVVPADFITDELPKLKGDETLVTIFAGGNDTNALANAAVCLSLGGATQAQIGTFVSTEIAAFGSDFQTIVAAIRAKSPSAEIVVANLPNSANLPFAKAPAVASARPLLQSFSVGIDTNVYQPSATVAKIPTVDLLCDPRSYDPANFYVDGFHPGDAGYAIFAAAFLAQIAATPPALPQTSCAQMALLGEHALGAVLTPLPNPERP